MTDGREGSRRPSQGPAPAPPRSIRAGEPLQWPRPCGVSNGRTPDSGSGSLGSSPSPAAIEKACKCGAFFGSGVPYADRDRRGDVDDEVQITTEKPIAIVTPARAGRSPRNVELTIHCPSPWKVEDDLRDERSAHEKGEVHSEHGDQRGEARPQPVLRYHGALAQTLRASRPDEVSPIVSMTFPRVMRA